MCAKKGGKTLLATRGARVFKKRFQIYACLRRGQRAFLLGRNLASAADSQVGDLRLRGRFVAYSFRGSWPTRVRVKELRRGRTVHAADATVVAARFRPADRPETQTKRVDRLDREKRPDRPSARALPIAGRLLPFWEVSKFDRARQVLLDSGRDIGASLLLRGATHLFDKRRDGSARCRSDMSSISPKRGRLACRRQARARYPP